jgi:phospholipid/cholesterol/gamma-HCH transport system permease protein
VAEKSTSVVKAEEANGQTRLVLSGHLDAPAVAAAWDILSSKSSGWTVDASALVSADGAGIAFLWSLRHSKKAEITGLKNSIDSLLEPFNRFDPASSAQPPAKEGAMVRVGRVGAWFFEDLRAQTAFVGELGANLASCLVRPSKVRWTDVWLIAQTAGVNALIVAGLVSLLTGMIMAFQSAVPLKQFGVDIFVVNLVALAMLRELGPIMTAVVLAGRSGSAFAAEIGTMKVNEELDALETMGLDPMRFLVIPRVLAGFVVTPILTIYSNALGIAGGFLVMMAQGFPMAALWNQLVGAVGVNDVMTGFIKSFVFGILVAGIGCLRGLQTGKGATAVGVSTTSAVVSGIFLIVVVDALFAAIFYVLKF